MQITRTFRRIWFRPRRAHGLGRLDFGIIWFAIYLLPVAMVLAAVGLVGLYFVAEVTATLAFQSLWWVAVCAYVFITVTTMLLDRETAKRSWLQGLLFPGVGALVVMVAAWFPDLLEVRLPALFGWEMTPVGRELWTLTLYAWSVLAMVLAWGVKQLERTRVLQAARAAAALPGGFRTGALRDHPGRVRQAVAGRRRRVGQDREDRAGDGMSESDDTSDEQAWATLTDEALTDEIRSNRRTERRLLVAVALVAARVHGRRPHPARADLMSRAHADRGRRSDERAALGRGRTTRSARTVARGPPAPARDAGPPTAASETPLTAALHRLLGPDASVLERQLPFLVLYLVAMLIVLTRRGSSSRTPSYVVVAGVLVVRPGDRCPAAAVEPLARGRAGRAAARPDRRRGRGARRDGRRRGRCSRPSCSSR